MTTRKDPAQERAIVSVGSDILVSASAGAGKTRVLVERLIKRCLTDHIELNQILAVTFTEAAASEMKNRIAKRLQEEKRTCRQPEQQRYLDDQMVYLQTADITTIDAFCLNIIKKYSSILGLDPQCTVNILDDGHRALLEQKAFYEALAAYDQAHHEELLQTLRMLTGRPEDYGTLFQALEAIAAKADSSTDAALWYQKARETGAAPRGFRDFPAPVRDAFFDELRLRYETIVHHLDGMLEHSQDTEKLKKGEAAIRAAQNLLHGCQDALDQMDYALFRQKFENFGNELKTPPDTSAELYTAARKDMNDAVNALAEILYEPDLFLRDTADMVPVQNVLLDLAEDMHARFQALKQKDACMDFSDMERYAWQILIRNDHAVARRFRRHYREVMVDEFQDTSVLQDSILRELAEPGTLFRVGDVKQSIYRFRQARPDLMRQIMQDEKTEQVTLGKNYRSFDNIVAFCNTLFGIIMNAEGTGGSYTEKDVVTIGQAEQHVTTPDPVRFILIDIPERKEKDVDSPDARQAKAEWIAAEMLRLVREENRHFNDFAVLVRSHHDKPVLRTVFERCGIPYDIDAREGFYQSVLCQTVLAFLRLLLDPSDEISLLAVLTSPLAGLSEEDLAGMVLRHGSISAGTRAEHPELLNEFTELLQIGRQEGALRLLDELADRHGFMDSLDHAQKANFDYLYEKAMQLPGPFRSIRDLLDLMEASQDESSNEAMSRSLEEQAVTVTTIHQSKGLQYKVVFLWGTDRNQARDNTETLLVDETLGLGLPHYDLPYRTRRPTVQRLAIEHRNSQEDLSEFVRLLYVAVTRPEEKLYIVDTTRAAQPLDPHFSRFTLNRRKGMSGLILAAMPETPGIFTICHVAPVTPEALSVQPQAFTSKLPRYHGTAAPLSPLRKPSEHALTALPDLDLTGGGGRRYGTRLHEVIADLPDTIWTREMLAPYQLRDNEITDLLTFAGSRLYQEALTGKIHKEFPFYTDNGRFRTTGAMDFVSVLTDSVILIDFKTDAAAPDILQQRYHDQIALYAEALRMIFPHRTIRCWIWSLASGQPVPMAIDQ